MAEVLSAWTERGGTASKRVSGGCGTRCSFSVYSERVGRFGVPGTFGGLACTPEYLLPIGKSVHPNLMLRLLFASTCLTTFLAASPITVEYTLNMGAGGSNKTDITSVAVFQASGSNLHLSFIPSIAGVATSVVSVAAPFEPSFSLLIGVSEPADATGRRHLIAFVSQEFSDTYTDIKFSEAFEGYGERAFGPRLIAAAAGDATEQEWLKTFYTTQGYKAAFATGSVPVAGEFTVFTPIEVVPEPSTYALAGFAVVALAAYKRKA